MGLSIHGCAGGFSLGPEVTIEEAVISCGAPEIVDFDRTGGFGRTMDL